VGESASVHVHAIYALEIHEQAQPMRDSVLSFGVLSWLYGRIFSQQRMDNKSISPLVKPCQMLLING
jgi:hypothetical protein